MLKLNFSKVWIDEELSKLCEIYRERALCKGITLDVLCESPIEIEADANQLRRVFTNLLDNSLKFSKEGSTIRVRVEETEKDVVVEVKDEGIGIDPKDIPYIFDTFHRGKGSAMSGGYGLGLAAAKAIVEGHGGKILVSSKLGKGSIFRVLLPKEQKTIFKKEE
ncbi:MAG: sensor histidine kinase [Nitrospirae bacterium]|nr:MAG: sensor histidine kinase [Nitrospirota bacterium]